MIRMQDIADMAGVSRTTVSNVLHGKTKRVSQETMEKIRKILEENEYEPNIASRMLAGGGSRIIGFVLGYSYTHGYPATLDPFVGELLASIQNEAEKLGYYIIIINADKDEKVENIASRWNIEGLIFVGFSEQRYRLLCRKLNKRAVMIDTYTQREEYDYQNVGIDDYNGGYQVGEYLLGCGYPDALYIVEETQIYSCEKVERISENAKFGGRVNQKRWKGFCAAMEQNGGYCSPRRYIVVNMENHIRRKQYEKLLPRILNAGALAMGSDYNAIEMINFLQDHSICVPDQVSVVGFDDCMYAEYIRPKLTTVHQDISLKGRTALRRLIKMIKGETLPEMYVSNPVRLVVRDSVKARRR